MKTPTRGQIKNSSGQFVFEVSYTDGLSNDTYEERKKKLKEWLFGATYTLVGLQNEGTLTASEIANYRDHIATLPTDQRAAWYLELQEKVGYKNQRDNESLATEEDIVNNSWMTTYNITTAGDIMCNLTIEAICLEYLGVAPPCSGCSSDCDSYGQYEDYLECVRVDKEYDHRKEGETRKKLAELFGGVIYTLVELGTRDKDVIEAKLQYHLEDGCSILLSAYGHIVRLQGITDIGLVVDDPYGKVVNFSASGVTPKYKINDQDYRNGKDFTNEEGKDNTWSWENIKNNFNLNYAEIYCKD